MSNKTNSPTKPEPKSIISGRGVGGDTRWGTARVIRSLADLSTIETGDVLVARFTSPDFNTVFHLVSAVVTDVGGVLSHAAVVARELGIPAVVGTKVATEVISDGDELAVNGQTGKVTVFAPDASQ